MSAAWSPSPRFGCQGASGGIADQKDLEARLEEIP